MIANNVQLLSKEVTPSFSAEDVAKIKKFGKQKSVVSILCPAFRIV